MRAPAQHRCDGGAPQGLLATEVVAARENRPATDAGEQAALLDLPNLLNVMRATAAPLAERALLRPA